MYRNTEANARLRDRGPRWAVSAGIRQGESRVDYCDTAEAAELRREVLIEEGHYQVRVWPPAGAVDLPPIGRTLAAARRAEREQADLARAATLRAAEEGRPEAAIARELGVDRMTVRKWLGK
jgi:hypothetical protein